MIGYTPVRDVNYALANILSDLKVHGLAHTAASAANARPTVEWPGVYCTEYLNPRYCVLNDPRRDANPFFHLLESLWIIAGRNDVRFLKYLLPNMANYSDDGRIFHGAYGYRLRYGFNTDQIEKAIAILKAKPTSRQVIMSIWNPSIDLGTDSKDPPCNDMLMLKIRDGKLNLTVNNRSNDAIWGLLGANVVQFSMLLMYMAARIGVGIGRYTQVSDSLHVYEDTPYWQNFNEDGPGDDPATYSPYQYESTHKHYIEAQSNVFGNFGDGCLDGKYFHGELNDFFWQFDQTSDELLHAVYVDVGHYEQSIVRDAALAFNALGMYRRKSYDTALGFVDQMRMPDWRMACRGWINRRIQKAS